MKAWGGQENTGCKAAGGREGAGASGNGKKAGGPGPARAGSLGPLPGLWALW